MIALELPEKLLLSLADVAAKLSLSPRFVWAICDAGDLKSLRVGTRVLVNPGDLAAWIESGCPHPKWSARQLEKKQAAKASPAKQRRAMHAR